MSIIVLVLLVAAFVLFILAACNCPSRIGLGWAGLACWCLSTFVGRF